MVERTSTGEAPWTLVESNDKNYARVKILRTLCERLEAALQDQPKSAAAEPDNSVKTQKTKKGRSDRKK
jgi:hypothetical protein